MTTLTVTVKERSSKGHTTGFEGTVDVPGLRRTKLARRDGTTLFNTTGALKTTARAVGRRFGLTVEYTDFRTKKTTKKSKK